MLTLEGRSELLVRASELNEKAAFESIAALLSPLARADLLAEPELGYLLAQSLFRLARLDPALQLVRDLAEPCRRRGYDRLYRRRLNLEAGLLVELGDTLAAEAAFHEVFQRSIAVGDQEYVAFATLNLGVVAITRAEWRQALVASHYAKAALHHLGNEYFLAGCYQNLAIACRELGLFSEADSHFEQAFQIFSDVGQDVELELAAVESERALSMNAVGDCRRAEATSRRALDRLVKVDAQFRSLTRNEGAITCILGVVLTTQCRFEDARASLERALECSRVAKVRVLEGEVAEALCGLAQAEGDHAESARWGAEAVRIYEAMGARARADRVRQQESRRGAA